MVIQWIIIALLVFFGLFFIKMEHHARKVKLVVILVIVALLYFSIMSIFKSDQVELSSPKGILNAVYVYFGWLGQTLGNLWDIGADTARTVGNAIKVNSTK